MTKAKNVKRREGPRIEQIRTFMADGKPRSTQEVCDDLDIALSVVVQYFRNASQPGALQEVHSIDNKGPNGAARFVIGKGKNLAIKRAPRQVKTVDEMTDAELDKKFKRTDFRSWPKADLLVIQSIDNMVRMGVMQ